MSRILSNLFTACLGAIIALGIFQINQPSAKHSSRNTSIIPTAQAAQATSIAVPMLDFTSVAERTMPTVVYIETQVKNKYNKLETYATGSGVLVSENGYLITNQHVIENADKITITLHDKRSFTGKIVGEDKDTDLAVIKIKGDNFPYLDYGNSDKLKVGAWVMAIGNPFNLTSTATVGIVSAKARTLNLSAGQIPLESFIQTDAVTNRGNSGGALINLKGELVGINTAIASSTGSFSGYSFAIPVTIVQKVVNDILKYGSTRRGFLGISVRNVDAKLAETLRLKTVTGVYIEAVEKSGAAGQAGIDAGDIIMNIEGVAVNSAPKLQEIVSLYHPGDVINIKLRNSKGEKVIKVKLKKSFPTE